VHLTTNVFNEKIQLLYYNTEISANLLV